MISNRTFYTILALCAATYLVGMFMIPLMDIDASQYASISREMLENHSYLQVFDLGVDYIDKPPMLFWLSALSMKILGVHDWSYRVPSFLFALLAIYATYRLALLFYRREIAQLAAMVLAASQALFLVTHDVRCDTMLLGWVTLSLWQLAAWYRTNRWKYFIIAFAAIAGGMMTKGPIALMVPAFAFVPHMVLRREWKQLFRWEYMVGLLIVAVLLVPMSIGLYQQFDLHPGKVSGGVTIHSGLRFFYWTQSFGRYTGENVYNELNYFTFLLENMLWSYLPWIVFFLIGLVVAVRELFLKKFRLTGQEEFFSAGGFIITYCILARSQAQLPHYIFVVFPLASIVTARFLFSVFFTEEWKRWRKPLVVFHVIVFALLWIACIGLVVWPFQVPVFVAIIAVACFGVFLWLLFTRRKLQLPQVLTLAFFTVIGVNIFLDTAFYPNVLKYQLGNDAARFIEQNHIDKEQVRTYGIYEGRALHFYGKHIFTRVESAEDLGPADKVITLKDSLPSLTRQFPGLKVLHEGPHFGVTSLSLPFLNPATRDGEVPKYVLLAL